MKWLCSSCQAMNPEHSVRCHACASPIQVLVSAEERRGLSRAEPPPVANASQPVWELVIQDMKDRDDAGRKKYGVPLQANNGRDALVDAYQEVLDLAVYLRQEIEERRERVGS